MLLSVAAVVIFRVLVITNHDELTMINTCCGLAVAVCVSEAWAIIYVFCIAPRVRGVCFLASFVVSPLETK